MSPPRKPSCGPWAPSTSLPYFVLRANVPQKSSSSRSSARVVPLSIVQRWACSFSLPRRHRP